MSRTSEFDAFGPWVDEVRTAGGLPRLYRDSGIDPAAYRLVLKVPRNIDRRNATPDMHLYDHVLAVDYENLVVLSRHGEQYTRTRLPLDRIVTIEDSVSMLDGRLILHIENATPVGIAYNGSAHPPIRDLIGLIRSAYLPSGLAPAGVIPPPPLDGVDVGLVTYYHRTAAREPGVRLVGAAAKEIVTPRTGLDRLIHRFRPVTLTAAITLTDDREIQLIHRRDWLSRLDPNHSIAHTVLPRTRIRGAEAVPHPRYRGVYVVHVHFDGTTVSFSLRGAAPVEAFLAAAAP